MLTLLLIICTLVSALSTQVNSAPTQGKYTNLGWTWAGENTSIPHDDSGVIEELATIELSNNSSCTEEINKLIGKLPFVDRELSYETFYDNGTRQLTVVRQVGGKQYRNDKRSLSSNSDDETGQKTETIRMDKGRQNDPSHTRQQRSTLSKPRPRKRTKVTTVNSVTAQKVPFSSTARVSCGRFCDWSCTGVLVGTQHVLTAAHCIYKERMRDLMVGFLERNGQLNWYSVAKFYVSYNFNSRKKRSAYDYALIKLNTAPERPALKMQTSPISRRTTVSFSAFDSDLTMRASSCQPRTQNRDVIVTRCDAVKGNSGAGLLVKSNKYNHVVVGVLSSRRAQTKSAGRKRYYYIATKLNRRKISQISTWIKKT